jgi:hypothetical protein
MRQMLGTETTIHDDDDTMVIVYKGPWRVQCVCIRAIHTEDSLYKDAMRAVH